MAPAEPGDASQGADGSRPGANGDQLPVEVGRGSTPTPGRWVWAREAMRERSEHKLGERWETDPSAALKVHSSAQAPSGVDRDTPGSQETAGGQGSATPAPTSAQAPTPTPTTDTVAAPTTATVAGPQDVVRAGRGAHRGSPPSQLSAPVGTAASGASPDATGEGSVTGDVDPTSGTLTRGPTSAGAPTSVASGDSRTAEGASPSSPPPSPAPAEPAEQRPTTAQPSSAEQVEVRVQGYEDMLLGGQPHLTARDLAGRTGTPLGRVDEFWLAMGFRTADPDEVAFTTRDLEAYGAWSRLIDEGAIDLATGRSLLRAQSHISDRLALWQVEALVEDVARRQDLDDTQARRSVLENMEGRVDFLEHALVYSWRRQLESLIARVDREVSQRGPDSGKRRFPLTRSLGFVDMVSYTSSSTILGSKLVGLIERFEDASRTAVTAAGGRVVKMIGDAVLFIADDLATGLRVVTSLIEALGADDQILPVRASFVRGDVFSRSGDVFGPPVNLASRLVDIAPEGRILTDATTAAAIAGGKGGSGYHLEDFPSAELRGFGTVSPYLLARDTQ